MFLILHKYYQMLRTYFTSKELMISLYCFAVNILQKHQIQTNIYLENKLILFSWIWWSLPSERRMSSSRLASTVCPHVGGKADLSSATWATDCADQVARWGCVFRAGVCRESLATSALLYLNSNTILLEVLHTGVTVSPSFLGLCRRTAC